MRTSLFNARAARLATLLIPLAAAGANAQNTYTLVDLGGLGFVSEGFALANADTLFAAGAFHGITDFHFNAFLAADAPTPLLPAETRAQGVAFDVTATGVVLGVTYNVGDIDVHGFLDDGQTQTDLGAFSPRAINASGTIAGTVNVATTGFGGLFMPRACRYADAAIQVLPTLGGSSAMGLTIDDAGRVAGSAMNANDAASRPCLWVGAIASDLGTLGGAMGQVYHLRGDTAVGLSTLATGMMHATKWTLSPNGSVASIVDLGSLAPNATSVAYASNTAGDIVGTSDSHAVLWHDGSIIDLNDATAGPYWVLTKAWDIDDAGRIVGTGLQAGAPRAFLLLPEDRCPPCAADFDQNGGISGDDLAAFFAYYERGWPCADVDLNGGIDGSDLAFFFTVFEAGGC